jgi:hypothetical protein
MEIILVLLGIGLLIGLIASICEAFEQKPRKTVVIHYR